MSEEQNLIDLLYERDATIKQLQESNEGIKQTNIEAYDRVKQLQEENQRLKDALAYALKHWGKADNLLLHQKFRDNARKMIES